MLLIAALAVCSTLVAVAAGWACTLLGRTLRRAQTTLAQVAARDARASDSHGQHKHRTSSLEALVADLSTRLADQDARLMRECCANRLAIKQHTTTLSKHETCLDGHEAALCGHETRLDRHVATILDHETTLDRHIITLGKHKRRVKSILDGHAVALQQHKTKLNHHGATLSGHEARLDRHAATLGEHNTALDGHSATLVQHESGLDDHTANLASHNARLTQLSFAAAALDCRLSAIPDAPIRPTNAEALTSLRTMQHDDVERVPALAKRVASMLSVVAEPNEEVACAGLKVLVKLANNADAHVAIVTDAMAAVRSRVTQHITSEAVCTEFATLLQAVSTGALPSEARSELVAGVVATVAAVLEEHQGTVAMESKLAHSCVYLARSSIRQTGIVAALTALAQRLVGSYAQSAMTSADQRAAGCALLACHNASRGMDKDAQAALFAEHHLLDTARLALQAGERRSLDGNLIAGAADIVNVACGHRASLPAPVDFASDFTPLLVVQAQKTNATKFVLSRVWLALSNFAGDATLRDHMRDHYPELEELCRTTQARFSSGEPGHSRCATFLSRMHTVAPSLVSS